MQCIHVECVSRAKYSHIQILFSISVIVTKRVRPTDLAFQKEAQGRWRKQKERAM